MIAETAFNVIQALPDKEYKRLLQMLGVESKPKKIKPRIGRSDAEWKEYLSKKLKMKNR